MPPYKHYGWLVSPYSAKTRAYLRYKQIPFEDIEPTARQLFGPIKKAVGKMVMPTVQRPDGSWMQDTSEIIDELEGVFPDRPIVPSTPRQRVLAYLLELFADEWVIALAIHFRWNYPENKKFAIAEFAKYGAPRLPGVAARALIKPIAEKMASYRPTLGITEATRPGFERFAARLFDALETHLAQHPFLFGTRPSLADFALFATPWAHVYRDPGTRHLFDGRPHCVAWFERLNQPSGEAGAFLEADEVPATLRPLVELMFEEHMPYLRELVTKIDAYCAEHPEATRVPRSLGPGPMTIGGVASERKLVTFSQWMAQRPVDAYRALDDEGRAAVDELLAPHGGLRLAIANPFERRDFKLRLAGR